MKPYLAMVSLQFGYAGMYIITMVCLKNGMSHYVLAVYRHAAATLAIAPFALLLERKIRPKMRLSTFLKIMALGLIEPVIDQNLYYLGMKYTSATLASASANVLPAITFVMAVICRLEHINMRKVHTQAKMIGTMVTVIGTLIMTVYKGPNVPFPWSSDGGLGRSHHDPSSSAASGEQHWLSGTLMLLARTWGWAGFFILQSFTLKEYPAELSLTCLICLMGTVQGAVVALVMERNLAAWAIGWDSRLLAAVYSGVVCSGIAYYGQGVVMKERGPVFVAAFSPLCMVITAALGSIILAEQIHLGSVIGAVVIVGGLYSVVWGKSKDPLILSSHALATTGDDEQKAAPTSQLELPIADTTKSATVTVTVDALRVADQPVGSPTISSTMTPKLGA
ncbi:WAT1-related protein At1g21890-like [Malania oleifera]|uniref:WAT1-related protein At1g21890-like n=1 Tax=Malania oleifera TaxID=397392 RepID=UPI0025ADF3C9|nr:WAT1-related protein At1g21890-like [Malania oleifera]